MRNIRRSIPRWCRRYVGTSGIKVLASAVTGLLVWAILTFVGLKLAGAFGILAFLLNFIPSIGSIIATLLPIPIAVVQFQSSPWLIVPVVAVPGLLQGLIGNIIEPKLQGEGLNLHPVTVILALSFWGLYLGHRRYVPRGADYGDPARRLDAVRHTQAHWEIARR